MERAAAHVSTTASHVATTAMASAPAVTAAMSECGQWSNDDCAGGDDRRDRTAKAGKTKRW